MRVLFVFPDLSANVTGYTGVPSYGIASLSAALKQAGHQVGLFHMVADPPAEEFRARVREAAPDLVAFSANSHYAHRLARWAALARSATRAPIAVGGVHATLAPEEVSAIPEVGFTCVGEGEFALPELCAALEEGRDPSGVANLWVRAGGSVIRNAPRPRCQDLDRLPDPDLGLFDFARLHWVRRGLFPYLMSRGCGFRCTYCSAHALRGVSPGAGPFWRFLSPERAARQLHDLLERHMPDAPRVSFLDAILFPSRSWLAEFAPLYRRHVGRPFACSLRADFVTPETAATLRDMGCAVARLGVESGNETMTTEVLQRGLTTEQIRRAFALLAEHGIERWSYNMVGLPGETLPMALETVRLNAEIHPEAMIAFIFYPYPGTRLHDLCAAQGYLTDKEYDHYTLGVTTHLPTFRASDVLFVHRFFAPLARLYGVARRWLPERRRAWERALDAVLTSPLLPRGLLLAVEEAYRAQRHRLGGFLVRRSPRLYHLLGGTDPL
jgi:radical SAM superfamily enzyme YgiQ (UPF0313 family)